MSDTIRCYEQADSTSAGTVFAAAIAGCCTFLNIYCTQPLLPLFQQVFHATQFQVSLTVGAVTLGVAVMAPVIGLLAERVERKKVIVTALFGIAVPTLLAAAATNLNMLIALRFAQGLFVPGVIAIMMAYINEEFPGRVGTVTSAYVTGNVFGGFLGRFLAGVIVAHWSWQAAFILLGIVDFIGMAVVYKWLPGSKNFVPATHFASTLSDARCHLRNPRLIAIFGMGMTILFSMVGIFTYANFRLAAAPFNLNTAALGSIFFVYLAGCVITPLSGRFFDRKGFRRTTFLSIAMGLAGLLLTLAPSLPIIIAGLALVSSGAFATQSAATSQIGLAAGRGRSSAAGLYVTFYYAGGSIGAAAPAWFWRIGGWPACVGLFAAVYILMLLFSLKAGRLPAEAAEQKLSPIFYE